MGAFSIVDKLVLELDGKKAWIFHGDVFDPSIQGARWLAKLGGKGYDTLIRLNRMINKLRNLVGLKHTSFSSRVKKGVKGAVRFIGDFEDIAIQRAAENGYDSVICGHIHQPQIRDVLAKNGRTVTYMNSGDWVEHLTALECKAGQWGMYQYHKADFSTPNPRLQVAEREGQSFELLREEFLGKAHGIAAFELV
jgi:UDP-2,3-diacylglucosamine pyrophosphatase LpxH